MLDSLCEYFYTSDAFPNTYIRNLKRLDGSYGKFVQSPLTMARERSYCVPEISMTHDYIVTDGSKKMSILPSKQPGKVLGGFVTDANASYSRYYVRSGSFNKKRDKKLESAWLAERGTYFGGSRSDNE